MTIGQAAALGGLQGITEFLPISSSGHLVLANALLRSLGGKALGAEDQLPLAFVVLVHTGSLVAIVAFFWREFLSLLTTRRRLIGLLVLGTIPAGVAFVILKAIEHVSGAEVMGALLERPLPVGIALLVTGAVLWLGEGRGEGRTALDGVRWSDGWWVGVAQAVAIVPGISRSGMTITAGLARDLERRTAVAFAFLLGAVAIAAGTVVELKDFERLGGRLGLGVLATGFAVSAAASLGALALLSVVVRRKRLRVFAVYCFVVGGASILANLWGLW